MATYASQMPYRGPPSRQQSRQLSTDPHNELRPELNHYIGIDVGTGSARACIMNDKGDIVGLASENIGLWQPETGYYEQSTTNIWKCICSSIQRAMSQHNVDPSTIRGLGFDAARRGGGIRRAGALDGAFSRLGDQSRRVRF